MTSCIIVLILGNNITAAHTIGTKTIHTSTKVKCYYCDGEHHIDVCEKFKKDKDNTT